MNQRALLFVTFALLVVTIVLFAIAWKYEQQKTLANNQTTEQKASAAASSGFDFLVQGRPVEAKLLLASKEIHRGDSLSVTLQLDKATFGTAGVGNEHDGSLTPTLSVGDCTVTPAQASSKSTDAMLPAFVWNWSVDNCQSSGDKVVQAILGFSGPEPNNGSDPIAFRDLQYVRVDDAFSWDLTLKIAGTIAALLTAASGLAVALKKKPSAA